MNKLERALSSFLGHDDLASPLAQVLTLACKRGKISYGEVQGMIQASADDVLLLGIKLRLLLPVRTLRSADWEDRVFLAELGEMYEVPNIIRFLVENAGQTGEWVPDNALVEAFRLAGEPQWKLLPKLVTKLGERSQHLRIDAVQIKEVCIELGLGNRVDALIAELKGSGVMSPKLGSLAEVTRAGFPMYELNPSIFIRKNYGYRMDPKHIAIRL